MSNTHKFTSPWIGIVLNVKRTKQATHKLVPMNTITNDSGVARRFIPGPMSTNNGRL